MAGVNGATQAAPSMEEQRAEFDRQMGVQRAMQMESQRQNHEMLQLQKEQAQQDKFFQTQSALVAAKKQTDLTIAGNIK